MRNVGVALDFSPSSKHALRWAIENLIRDGDSIIIITVQPKGVEPAIHVKTLWAETGSPLIPFHEVKDPNTQRAYGIIQDAEVNSLLDNLNLHKDVTIHMKLYWGDPSEKICDATTKVPLHTLIMGSRGHGTVKRVLLGSVSNHVVHHVTCPVIVVKLPTPM